MYDHERIFTETEKTGNMKNYIAQLFKTNLENIEGKFCLRIIKD